MYILYLSMDKFYACSSTSVCHNLASVFKYKCCDNKSQGTLKSKLMGTCPCNPIAEYHVAQGNMSMQKSNSLLQIHQISQIHRLK